MRIWGQISSLDGVDIIASFIPLIIDSRDKKDRGLSVYRYRIYFGWFFNPPTCSLKKITIVLFKG